MVREARKTGLPAAGWPGRSSGFHGTPATAQRQVGARSAKDDLPCHPRAGGGPSVDLLEGRTGWIPAFAGMTTCRTASKAQRQVGARSAKDIFTCVRTTGFSTYEDEIAAAHKVCLAMTV